MKIIKKISERFKQSPLWFMGYFLRKFSVSRRIPDDVYIKLEYLLKQGGF